MIYRGWYVWMEDFPQEVNYTIGTRNPAVEFNFIHWSVFRPNIYGEYDTMHD